MESVGEGTKALHSCLKAIKIHSIDEKILEQVLEQGPWLIWNTPLILLKWSPNMSLSKDKVTKVPVWVKLHRVPTVVAYSEDGLSLIGSQIRKPIMLDAFTSSVCVDPWGRIGFARALIEVSAEADRKHEKLLWQYLMKMGRGVLRNELKWNMNESRLYVWIVMFLGIHRNKGKNKNGWNMKKSNGVKVSNPNSSSYYRLVATQKVTNKKNDTTASEVGESSWGKKSTNVENNNGIKLKNLFEKLNEITTIVDPSGVTEKSIDSMDKQNNEDLDSEVEEISNANLCTKGYRIILVWNVDVVNVMVLSQTNQVMHVKVNYKDTNKIIFCSFIYVGNLPAERRLLWANLGLHKNVVRGCPWILMSDFNVALNLEDNYSDLSSLNSAMYEFEDCVSKIEVMDVNSTGLHYNWNQKPKGGGALKILNIAMNKPKPFKFFNFLTFKSKFCDVVASRWKMDVSGHDIFQVVSKMKALKNPFRKLVHDHGNLHDRVNKLRLELDEVQKELDRNPDDAILKEEEAVYVKSFAEAKIDEECFLKQKVKVEWLEVGNSNSTYFHKSVESRNQRSRIEVIRDADNAEITGSLVADAFVSHYHQFLGTTMDCDELVMEGLFEKKVSDTSNLNMVRYITNEYIKAAMSGIGDGRSPGPDGYTSAFFKKSWDILGSDICSAVRDFFSNSQLLKEINHTFIALIPKGIKEVVSKNQSAFVSGRRISNNILITQELMHSYHINHGLLRCAFKIDIQKAYDTVDWRFLKNNLLCFGFHPTMVSWIMSCLTSTSFSININGDIHGYFKGGRGLRQDDLFIFARGEIESSHLIMKSFGELPVKYLGVPLISSRFLTRIVRSLSKELRTVLGSGRISIIQNIQQHLCEQQRIINLCFTDDLFLFARGYPNSVRVIIDALEEFKNVLGLVLSIPKSTAFFCNVPTALKASIFNSMPFAECTLPIKYLGVPLISFRLLYRDYKVLVEKLESRVNDWRNKFLSLAEQLMRGFLWCQVDMKKGNAKVAWEAVCLPYREGGLGIRRLDDFNVALMATHVCAFTGMSFVPPCLVDVLAFLISSKGSSVSNVISRIVLAARTYCLWNEWNSRLFKKKKSNADQIVQLITTLVQMKLVTFRFKKMSTGSHLLLEQWKIPSSCFDHDRSSRYLTPRDITSAGFNIKNCVVNLIANGGWLWPQAWLLKAPDLGLVPVPTIIDTRAKTGVPFESPRFCPLGFLGKGFLRRQAQLDAFPPYVWVSGGSEAILHAVNRLIEGYGDDVGLLMLLVDFKNAFNLVDQEVMLRKVRLCCHAVSRWVEFCYSNPARLYYGEHTLWSCQGVPQAFLCKLGIWTMVLLLGILRLWGRLAGVFSANIAQPLHGVKLLGGTASVNFDFCNDLVMKRVDKTIVLMDAVAKINDPQCELLLLRSCMERIVIASGPGFDDWQWRLATLPFAFWGLG
nr:hypothetical protein [Tanacetum cinerariifolium]